jgi:hypothetical protein
MAGELVLAATAATKPAGGAATREVIGATTGAILATSILFALAIGHRSGRIKVLGRLANRVSRLTGLPPWAALPADVLSLALFVALFGMYWDISLHIDNGRDPGPLANPAHYFILVGLFLAFSAGVLAVTLSEERPSRAAVRLGRGWYAPVGGLMLLACSSFSLAGFPLDDFWHRLFGQDVTLWGPTHLMLIGGAGLSLVAYAALVAEGRSARVLARGRATPLLALVAKFRYAGICGGLLIGLSTFQAEFDFGVPQFRLLFQPVLIAVAAGAALVTARIYAGRGAPLFAVGFFLVVRGALMLLVGPILGEATPHFPLYLAEGVLVEATALAIAPRARPYLFGAVSGVLIGTVGFAAEFGWSHVWMPTTWPSALIGEALPIVPIAGIAGGLIGGFVGAALAAPRIPEVRLPRLAPAALGLAAIVAIFAYGLDTTPERGVLTAVHVHDVGGGPGRQVSADIRISPPSAVHDADWVQVLAWQGGGMVLDRLDRTGPGSYRTTKPIPAHGSWKALVRLHRGDSLLGAPIYLPADQAIAVNGVPAPPSFIRPFVKEKKILQREQKSGVSPALATVAYSVVGAIALALILALGWTLTRLGRSAGLPEEQAPASRSSARYPKALDRLPLGAHAGPGSGPIRDD